MLNVSDVTELWWDYKSSQRFTCEIIRVVQEMIRLYVSSSIRKKLIEMKWSKI